MGCHPLHQFLSSLRPGRIVMSSNESGEPVNADKPVDIDPRWCVPRKPGSIVIIKLTSNSIKRPCGCTFSQSRTKTLTRLLHHAQLRGNGVRYGTHEEAQRGPQYFPHFCRSRRPLGRPRCSPHPQAGLFSAVSSPFVIDVQSKLDQIPATGRKDISMPSFSASTGLLHPPNNLQPLLHGTVPSRRQ